MTSLEHLVEHYMRFSDGLPTKLRYPVKPIPKPQLPPPLPPSPATMGQTLPKSYKFFKKNRSSNVQIPTDVKTDRKMSKDGEILSQTTSPETKERNLSLPSDALMNQVALSSPTLANANLSSNDTTLPLMSKAKKFNSLRKAITRKSKKESKSKSKEVNDSNENALSLMNDQISKSFTTIAFSSDIDDNAIYKVPKNIPAVLPDSSPNRLGFVKQNKTYGITEDMELFTKSDKNMNIVGEEIHDKDNSIEEIYFVEAPTKSMPISSESIKYVAFKQTPYFPHTSSTNDADIINGNIVNSNKTTVTNTATTRSERVLSVDSTISNDLDMMLAFQNPSNANGSTKNASATEIKTRPNYYIPATSIKLSDEIGLGEFGSVYKGHMKCESLNGESKEIPIAVKTLHDEHIKENRIEFLREASVMIKLSHHCIVKMIGISKVKDE